MHPESFVVHVASCLALRFQLCNYLLLFTSLRHDLCSLINRPIFANKVAINLGQLAILDIETQQAISDHVFATLACRLSQGREFGDSSFYLGQRGVKVLVNE